MAANDTVDGIAGTSIVSSYNLGVFGPPDSQIFRLASFVVDQLATISAQQTNEFGVAGQKIRAGTTSCTNGVNLATATGLTTVTHAVVCVKAAAAGTGAMSATYAINADTSKIDLYAWDKEGAAAATCNVSWIAWGT